MGKLPKNGLFAVFRRPPGFTVSHDFAQIRGPRGAFAAKLLTSNGIKFGEVLRFLVTGFPGRRESFGNRITAQASEFANARQSVGHGRAPHQGNETE